MLAAAPAAVTLRFSEAVTPAGAGITVLAPSGRRAGAGPAHAAGASLSLPLTPAGEGTYLVRWQVIAEDTHPSRGQFTFSVGRPGPAPQAADLGADVGAVSPAGLLLQTLARWLHFLGLALAAGTVVFRLTVLPAPRPGQAGALERLATAGIALLVAAEAAALSAEAVSLGVLDADLLDSSFGRLLGLRLGGALLLWAAMGAVRQAGRGRGALLALGAGIALLDGASGHRIAAVPDLAAFGLSAVHEAAMAVWAGGLAAVLALRLDPRRFARPAAITLAVLVASGGLLALSHLRGPADLLSSTYGAVLAVKVVAVGAAVAVAIAGARRLEAIALAGVLALAGLLISLPPPR